MNTTLVELGVGSETRPWNGNYCGPKRKDGLPNMSYKANYKRNYRTCKECMKDSSPSNLTPELLACVAKAAGSAKRTWNRNLFGPKRNNGLPNMRYSCNYTPGQVSRDDTELLNAYKLNPSAFKGWPSPPKAGALQTVLNAAQALLSSIFGSRGVA